MRVVFSYPCFENLGLEYLSACLLQAGFETKLVFDPQLFNDPFVTIGPLARAFDVSASLPAQVLAEEPGLVAISVLAANYQWALDLAAGIRASSDVPIVFGGIHASAAPEAVMENPQVDYCIVGEGEQPLVQLATGDSNADRRVDVLDLPDFVDCLLGPGTAMVDPTCAVFDFDVDGDVDVKDAGTWTTLFTLP